MHGNRRRKKRPSYGVRTVEITKGHCGFGFTISGQAPCILSCIVPGSPAEKAGLRPGDYLIAVNGQNVSKAPHDDVVRLIGQSKLLKLQIAENYYSDSSDDEFTVNRPKPKYPNRLRHKHQQTRAEKVVRDLQSGAIFSEHAAIHNSENAPLSDRDWADPYPSNDQYCPPNTTPSTVSLNESSNLQNKLKPSISPTRLRGEQMCVPISESLQVPRIKDDLQMHPPRVRQVLKKREKILKGTPTFTSLEQQQFDLNEEEIEYKKDDTIERQTNQQTQFQQQQQQQFYSHQHQQVQSNQQQQQRQQPQCQQQHQHQQPKSQPKLQDSQQQQQNQLNSQVFQQQPQPSQHQQLEFQKNLQQQHQNQVNIRQQNKQLHQQKQSQLQVSRQQQQILQPKPASIQDHQKQESNQSEGERIMKSQLQQPLSAKQNFQHHHMHNGRMHPHKHTQKLIAFQNLYCAQNQNFPENIPQPVSSHQHTNLHYQQNKGLDSSMKTYSQHHSSQLTQYLRQQHLNRQLNNKQTPTKPHQPEYNSSQLPHAYTSDSSCAGITEQDINNLLYPTLAEIQQNQLPREDIGEVIYRAVVGYLGTIEMPKEPQGGSRLTAIRNCIRRLRIEKKVHTLVLMSILSEQVILTNPHGLSLAEYPAERITFCGVYADDKKFFGLVTIHGNSGDELSDGSQDEGNDPPSSASSSCHVFMVDPNAVHHPDHCRRAKNFRIECTPSPAQEDGSSHCLEFPDSADPILHSIMSLYRNRVGFHLESGAPGLIDVDAQMSPQHSNTSSNSSNSDSGIGFRDEGGGHHYHNSDRVFVVEFDDNQRTLLQNVQVVSNLRGGGGGGVVVCDNQRSAHNNPIPSISNANVGEASDILTPSSSSLRNVAAEKGPLHTRTDNCISSSSDRTFKSNLEYNRTSAKENIHPDEITRSEMDENLRVSVCDPQKLKELRATLLEGRKSIADGRTSVTDEIGYMEGSFANKTITPGRECTSPQDGCNRLTVRAMPDPVSFERSPGYIIGSDFPIQVSSMRHSMHKYLQHKQEHLVKVSQKINRRESDSGSVPHPLNIRTFSPSVGKRTQTPSKTTETHQNMDLSLKLSPKVFGVPFRPSAPSEHSFTRSLEDLRDSSMSDGVCGSLGLGRGSFQDGSESDHGFARLLHASETNLVRSSPTGSYTQEPTRGAFRAVHPRNRRNNQLDVLPSVTGLPRVGHLSEVGGMRSLQCLGSIRSVGQPLDSGDENTETTENTGGQGGSQDVHPPTQDEFSHDSDSEQQQQVEGSEGKKARGTSLRRLSRSRHDNDRPPATSDSNATQSDTEIAKISGTAVRVGNSSSVDVTRDGARVDAWAVSFEKLIEDPAGLHTFAEFLKKEYSHENIYFWTACERYRTVEDQEERREMAKAIFARHLGMSAAEPVNVDSHARQVAQDGLATADQSLFSAAQKQIFNLMKFDSYTRFLKSDLYNKCLSQERKGQALPYPGDESLDPDLGIFSESHFSKHLKKSKSDAEERRRKSLLPWHRKDRSKSKDRGEAEYWRRKKLGHRTPSESSSAKYDLSDSHTSLSSSDFASGTRALSKESLTSGEAVSLSGSEGLSLCRFILPDQSNSVLAVRSGETVKELVRQLLDRRRINFTEFNVVLTKGNKIVDLNKDSTVLGGHEARLERMVLFSLYLPSRKTVIVKAKPHKLVCEVLKPILSKYGLKLDLMVIHKFGEAKVINVKSPVTDLDGEKLIVQTKEEVKEWTDPGRAPKRNSTLDEITNKVFEDLLNGKTKSNFDDLGILDFDSRSTKTDPTSDTSSSLLGNLGRRESLSLERNLSSRQSGGGRGLLGDPSYAGKRRDPPPTYSVNPKQENDLYEGLKRAQMYRLEDQRGTEINFELPDFLKSDRNQGTTLLSHFDRSFHSASSDGTEPNEFLSRAHPEVWGGIQKGSPGGGDSTLIAPVDLDLDDLEETLRPLDHDSSSCNGSAGGGIPPHSPYMTPPPPLPPKPKLGSALRGPPPRPPSRQLPPLHLLDVPIRMTANRQPLADKLSVSFV